MSSCSKTQCWWAFGFKLYLFSKGRVYWKKQWSKLLCPPGGFCRVLQRYVDFTSVLLFELVLYRHVSFSAFCFLVCSMCVFSGFCFINFPDFLGLFFRFYRVFYVSCFFFFLFFWFSSFISFVAVCFSRVLCAVLRFVFVICVFLFSCFCCCLSFWYFSFCFALIFLVLFCSVLRCPPCSQLRRCSLPRTSSTSPRARAWRSTAQISTRNQRLCTSAPRFERAPTSPYSYVTLFSQ